VNVQPGDRVLYTLDTEDAESVNRRRADFQSFQALYASHKHPHGRTSGGSGASGHVAHTGLQVHAGQELPADVVIVSESRTLCLRVLLPGSDVQWVMNVPRGDGPGQWRALPGAPLRGKSA
jgi:hypothetical protein